MMLYKLLFSILLLFLSLDACAFDTLKVEASLDTARKEITGNVSLNLSIRDSTDEIIFQLFPNLYSVDNSPYEWRRSRLYELLKQTGMWGGMVIDSVLINGINKSAILTIENLSAQLDLNDIKVADKIQIRLYFTTRIPGIGDRYYYIGNDYMLDGWFPFPPPRDEKGNSNMPIYGPFSELVGDYYYYDINLFLPDNLVIAAPVSSVHSKSVKGIIHHRLQFGPAHDFALALSPDFMIDSLKYNGINILLYYHDYDIGAVSRVKEAVKYSLEYMSENIGPYEYENISIAIVNTAFSGGVEFPGFISLSSPKRSINKTNMYDILVMHEIVHQWFYGMVGSDQTEEPWLDEAITSFFTLKIAEKYWDENSNLLDFAGMKLSERDFFRLSSQFASNQKDINDPAYSFINNGEYFGTIYYKGGLIVETLNNLLPDSIVMEFWKSYFGRFKFKQNTTNEFITFVSEIAGDKFGKIADYLINDIVNVDYSVEEITNISIDSTTFESILQFRKTGALNIPIAYRVILSNNDTLDYEWVPKYNIEEIRHQFTAPVEMVIVDPDNKITMDANLLNNSLTVDADHRPGLRLSSGLMFLIESLFSFVGGI